MREGCPKMRWCCIKFAHRERRVCGLPKMRWSFTRFVLESGTASAGTEFRNCAPGRWGLGLQLVGRMGEWSWLAAAGPARVGGVPGPAGLSRPVYGAAQGPSALPSAIPLTFASRSGSSSGALVPGCSLGSLAFEPRPSSACPARATWREDVCVSGGTSPLVTASKRVSPFRDPCSEGGGASAELIIEFVRWCRFAW